MYFSLKLYLNKITSYLNFNNLIAFISLYKAIFLKKIDYTKSLIL